MEYDKGIEHKTFSLHTSTLRKLKHIKNITLNKKVTDDELFTLLIESFSHMRHTTISWIYYTELIANSNKNSKPNIKEDMIYKDFDHEEKDTK